MNFLVLFSITLVMLAIVVIFLSVKMIVQKNGKFPQTRIGHNKTMRQQKIYCPKTMDKMARSEQCKECTVSHLQAKAR